MGVGACIHGRQNHGDLGLQLARGVIGSRRCVVVTWICRWQDAVFVGQGELSGWSLEVWVGGELEDHMMREGGEENGHLLGGGYGWFLEYWSRNQMVKRNLSK